MIKKTLTYVDPDGATQVEDHYFNITVQQIVEDQEEDTDNQQSFSVFKRLQDFDPDKVKGRDIMTLFRDMVKISYGIRSDDGKRFIKSEEISNDFMTSFAYDELYGQLITDAAFAVDFIENLFPKKILDQVSAQTGGKTLAEAARERSEASLQGHKEKAVESVPEIETLQITEGDAEEEQKARKKADLERQLADLE